MLRPVRPLLAIASIAGTSALLAATGCSAHDGSTHDTSATTPYDDPDACDGWDAHPVGLVPHVDSGPDGDARVGLVPNPDDGGDAQVVGLVTDPDGGTEDTDAGPVGLAPLPDGGDAA